MSDIEQYMSNDIIRMMSICSMKDIEETEENIKSAGIDIADKLNEEGMQDKLVEGMYLRILKIPKGTFLVGKIHKAPYLDFCILGSIMVRNFYANGSSTESELVEGFRVLDGHPGRKRVGMALEDTVWMTVDRTEANNVIDAEKDIVFAKSHEYKAMIGDIS